MTFTLKPAVREQIGMLFGIAGPSGSGKTFSALLLASGIVNGTGRIAVIDTEAGRALHYAPPPGEKADNRKTFDFLHLDFQPPYAPERYIEAIRAAEEAGATVIVIDSMSHEWAGEGGCADIQAAEAERMAGGQAWKVEAMTAPAWKKPKLRHQRMMARLIQCRTHLIFCLRAQEKIKIVKVMKDGKERSEIQPMGFMPICEKAFMFELTGSMTMHPETPGQPRYDMQHKLNADLRAIFPDGKVIDAEAGKRLREWSSVGALRQPSDRVAEGVRELIERIQDAPTREALEAITASEEVQKQRRYLSTRRLELAAQVDDAIAAALSIFDSNDEQQAA
ncbi:MAG: hypothetical protein EBR82_60550 [Caulobacteraceae bacterium]|nr:hypothetical protein [Caulobacteraceae bacterium]